MDITWLRSLLTKDWKLGWPRYPGSREKRGLEPGPGTWGGRFRALPQTSSSRTSPMLKCGPEKGPSPGQVVSPWPGYPQGVPARGGFSLSASLSMKGTRNKLTSESRKSGGSPGKMLHCNMDSIPGERTLQPTAGAALWGGGGAGRLICGSVPGMAQGPRRPLASLGGTWGCSPL